LKRLVERGALDRVLATAPSRAVRVVAAMIGTTAVVIGLTLVGMILYAVLS
jgi:hypothetical protein